MTRIYILEKNSYIQDGGGGISEAAMTHDEYEFRRPYTDLNKLIVDLMNEADSNCECENEGVCGCECNCECNGCINNEGCKKCERRDWEDCKCEHNKCPLYNTTGQCLTCQKVIMSGNGPIGCVAFYYLVSCYDTDDSMFLYKFKIRSRYDANELLTVVLLKFREDGVSDEM